MEKFILFIMGLLFFILPISHTIAVRYILFGILIISIIYIGYKKFNFFKIKEIQRINFILLILTIWIIIDSLFAIHSIQWGEIKGEWIIPLVYFYVAIMIANVIDYKKVLLVLVIALSVHVIYIDLYAGYNYVYSHAIIRRFAGLTGGPDKSNYLTNILFAFLITEIIFRIRIKKTFIPIDNWFLGILFILTLISSLIEGMRNGVIAILFLSLSSIVFTFYNNNNFSKSLKIFISIFLIISFSLPAIYNFKTDSRWQTLLQTIPVATDIENNKWWLNEKIYPRPKLANGEYVNSSNYERVAWATAAVKEIIKHPFGVGYSRNAFRHAVQLDYKNSDVSHSHSAMLDFILGVGIIGLILWIWFILAMIYYALKYFRIYDSYFGVFLFFNVSGFFVRSIVDSNMRDHMFLTFMFLIGISFMYMLKEKNGFIISKKN